MGLILSACGGPDPTPLIGAGPAVFMRLPLERTAGFQEATVVRAAHFELGSKGMGDWIAEAPQSSARFIPPEDARIQEAEEAGVKPKRVRAAYLTGEGAKALRIPCGLEAGSFNRVVVNVRNYGRSAELLSVVLRKEGKVVDDLQGAGWIATLPGGLPRATVLEGWHRRGGARIERGEQRHRGDVL
jgi:hypothetical protein